MTKLRLYRPYKPGNHPRSLQTVETFSDGSGKRPLDDDYYALYEDRGDVFVFSVTQSAGSQSVHCAKFTSSGMCILAGDAGVMLAECEKKASGK